MKCLVRINELYLKDFDVKMSADENLIKRIELDSKKYYECESGQEADFLKFLIVKELGMNENDIKIFAIEGYKGKEEIPGQKNIYDYIK